MATQEIWSFRCGAASAGLVGMHIIVLDYIAPLERIDDALPEHVAWLDRHYVAGTFIASGRQEPRVGGVILAADVPGQVVREAAAGDPFLREGLATHRHIEFHPSRLAAELADTGVRNLLS